MSSRENGITNDGASTNDTCRDVAALTVIFAVVCAIGFAFWWAVIETGFAVIPDGK